MRLSSLTTRHRREFKGNLLSLERDDYLASFLKDGFLVGPGGNVNRKG